MLKNIVFAVQSLVCLCILGENVKRMANRRKRTWMQQLGSAALMLLGFSACVDGEEEEDRVLMYGTISRAYIRVTATNAEQQPVTGIRTVLEYENRKKELARDTVYTGQNGVAFVFPTQGVNETELEQAKGKLILEDVDGEQHGAYENQTVDISLKKAWLEGEEVVVVLKEKQDGK